VHVCVVTTSYPRSPADVAGVFVAEQVAALRAAGVAVEVVSPATVRHYGIAYGDGIVRNLRARPWLLAALPLFLLGLARAARRAARRADVVHAHWLPSALPALATRKPLVLQFWGTDAELARRAPRLARPLVRRARLVVVASAFLARAAGELGAAEVRVIASPVDIPVGVAPPEEPARVLFAGRLSEEKGITDFLAATEGLPRLIVGDGPLRAQVPEATGFVPHERIGEYYARAAVVCVPSRREGYGMVAREAMAYARPVVSTGAGGLADAVTDGEHGLVVEPGDSVALRAAIERLLTDGKLRTQLGAAGRERARREFGIEATTTALVDAYSAAAT
jgi:glycosyltransferase involved in cell wall biosynthesis